MDHGLEELPEIERSLDVPAPPERVWEMIVDGDLAEEWMGVRVDPRAGGAVTVPGRDVLGAVEEIILGESITWSWREVDGEPSQVTIDLVPDGDGTTVTIVERLLEYRTAEFPPIFLGRAA